MISTLKDYNNFKEMNPGVKCSLERRVQYTAIIEGMRYELLHDWTVALLDEKLEQLANRPEEEANDEKSLRPSKT